MSVKSMHEALMEMAQNQLDEAVKYTHVLVDKDNKVVAAASDEKGIKQSLSTAHMPPMSIKDKSTLKIVKLKKPANQKRLDSMRMRGLDEERATELDERMNAPIVHDGAKRAKDDLASASSNLNAAAKNAKTGKKGLQKAKKEVGVAQSTLKGTKLESVERATWVPDTIADEQVEEFMEAAITSMLEGADTFMFEGKHYKTKKKSEAKLDPVGQADADIDNDGDVDSSDKYLHKRRKAIKKSMKNDDEDKKELDEEEKKGLWYNIHKKRKEGRPMRKPGSKGAPTDQDFKDAQKTSKKESVEEATAQTGKDAATTDTFQKQMGGGRSPLEKQFVDMHKMEVELDAEKINDENKANIEKALKQTPARMGDNLKNGDTSFVSPLKADIIDGITKALQQMKTNN